MSDIAALLQAKRVRLERLLIELERHRYEMQAERSAIAALAQLEKAA